MTSVLRDLQAGYDQRAQMALEAPGEALEAPARPKATRTYTGASLERRKAWGRKFGKINSDFAKQLHTYGEK